MYRYWFELAVFVAFWLWLIASLPPLISGLVGGGQPLARLALR